MLFSPRSSFLCRFFRQISHCSVVTTFYYSLKKLVFVWKPSWLYQSRCFAVTSLLLHHMLLQDASFQEEDLEGRFLRSYSWLQDNTQKDLAVSSIDLKCKAFYESSVYRTVRGNSNGTFVLSNQTFPLLANRL